MAHCPTCGTELAGRAICPRCGTLAAAEFKLARLQSRASQFVENRIATLPRRFRPHHFLWACAVMPVFVLPPLVSLAAAVNAMRQARDGAAMRDAASYEWIAIISLLNILLSGLFLYKFHFSPFEVAAYLGDFLRAALHRLTPYWPVTAPPPKPIPA